MSGLEFSQAAAPRVESRLANQRAASPRLIEDQRPADAGAHGGTVGTRVGELAVEASHAALGANWDGGAGELAARKSMRALCHAARAGSVPIEQLLILIKSAWHQLPDNRRRMDPATQATLARIVTICIHEYYRPRDPS